MRPGINYGNIRTRLHAARSLTRVLKLITKLRAARAAEEEFSWNDKKIRVVKLTARLGGFFSLFWQATYWHRLPEMTFLWYKADGLPGVPKVDIQLVREKGVEQAKR